jgi:hypothetical protein
MSLASQILPARIRRKPLLSFGFPVFVSISERYASNSLPTYHALPLELRLP